MDTGCFSRRHGSGLLLHARTPEALKRLSLSISEILIFIVLLSDVPQMNDWAHDWVASRLYSPDAQLPKSARGFTHFPNPWLGHLLCIVDGFNTPAYSLQAAVHFLLLQVGCGLWASTKFLFLFSYRILCT